MIIPVTLLLSLSVAILYSYDLDTPSSHLAIYQLVFGIVGIFIYFLVKNFDYRALKQLIKPSFVVVLLLLAFTDVLGLKSHGAVRWIDLGPFRLQPSELAKPVLIMALADFWSKRQSSWLNIGKSLLIILPFVVFIFRQPDLGTALTLGFIWCLMLFAANISFLKAAILTLVGVGSVPISLQFLHGYQRDRLLTFLSPTQDAQGAGFHVIQSMIAVGSGQLLGRGIGHGTQSRLKFLPEFQTDFIYAFISEELGFLGSVLILILYGVLFYLAFKVLSQVHDRFGELIIIGVMAMLIFQITINIGMNIGIMPVTGITLPLLSYGGSSLITVFLSLGLVASVKKFGTRKAKEIETFDLL